MADVGAWGVLCDLERVQSEAATAAARGESHAEWMRRARAEAREREARAAQRKVSEARRRRQLRAELAAALRAPLIPSRMNGAKQADSEREE